MKRIISIDGGGIRGIFALQILGRIEALMRQRRGRRDLVLADEVDFFAGTSTGAVIATCLSWGMTVAQIERLYVESGSAMFARSPWRLRWRAKYRADRLAAYFRELFAEPDGTPATLGTRRLRTLLLVVVRNATTGSPWPLTNHPEAKYNRSEAGAERNLDIPLWQLLRASTAAPTYFTPEMIEIGGRTFLFVDGGITPYNNPALLSAMMATLPCYAINWPTGPDRLHLTSVGTGGTRTLLRSPRSESVSIFRQIGFVPPALIGSVSDQQDMLCRVLGRCLHGAELDREVGRLDGPSLLDASEQKFAYLRYNRRLDVAGDASLLPPLAKAKLDDLSLIPELRELGRDYAERHVHPEHLFPADADADDGVDTAAAAPRPSADEA
ncbi:MAG: patatin-like phospholipase family protein [Planctomycetota bacterium]